MYESVSQTKERRQSVYTTMRHHADPSRISRMRKFSYWLCVSLVAIPSGIWQVAWLLSFFGIALPAMSLLYMFTSFGSLVPQMFAHLVPRMVVVVLGFVMIFLAARRVWLLAAKREGVPRSYVGVPKLLGYVGAWSIILALAVLLLSIALRAGSGVPAGMLLIPASFCVPWAFFLTEVLSLRPLGDRQA
jgi:hypothetical protein